MITPTKHQNLNSNIIVVGAEILQLLKKDDFTLEELFQKAKINLQINLELFFDVLTFLWLIDAITINEKIIKTKIYQHAIA